MKGQCSRKGRMGKGTVYKYKKDGWRDSVLAKEGLVKGLCMNIRKMDEETVF